QERWHGSISGIARSTVARNRAGRGGGSTKPGRRTTKPSGGKRPGDAIWSGVEGGGGFPRGGEGMFRGIWRRLTDPVLRPAIVIWVSAYLLAEISSWLQGRTMPGEGAF